MSPGCPCGGSYQNARHVVMDCPLHEEGREEMLSGGGTRNYSILMNEPKGIKACVKWVMRKRLLAQFNFAQDMEEEKEREEEHQATWQDWQNELNLADEQTNGEQEAPGSEEEESEEEIYNL